MAIAGECLGRPTHGKFADSSVCPIIRKRNCSAPAPAFVTVGLARHVLRNVQRSHCHGAIEPMAQRRTVWLEAPRRPLQPALPGSEQFRHTRQGNGAHGWRRCKPVIALAFNRCMTRDAAAIVIRIPIVASIPVTGRVGLVHPRWHVGHHCRRHVDRRPAAFTGVRRGCGFTLRRFARLVVHLRTVVTRRVGQRHTLKQEYACHGHNDDAQKPHGLSAHQ